MKKTILIITIVVCGLQVTSAQDVPKAVTLLQQALTALQPTVVVPAPIATPAALLAAVTAAAPGDVLTLSQTLIYPDPLTLNKSITLQGENEAHVMPGTLMTPDEPLPRFLAGLTITGPKVTLKGIDVRQTSPLVTILVMAGDQTRLERVRVLGDSVKGAKRGIQYTGSNGVIVDSYVDDIFQPAQDTQAIYSDNMGPGTFLIDHCYLRAAGEVVMFGGGDPATPDRQPHDVTLNNSVLDKRPEWKLTQQIKCSLELKNINGFQSKGCTFKRGGGISQGQGGYAFDLTPRNQNGTAPTTSVQNVVIEDFTIDTPGSGIATITGSDNNFLSGPLKNVTLRRGVVTNVDHNALDAVHTTGRLFTFERAPQQVTITDMLIKGVGIRSVCYFLGLQPPIGLTLGRISVDNAGAVIPYKWKLDGNTHPVGAVPWPTNPIAAMKAYMLDVVLDETIF